MRADWQMSVRMLPVLCLAALLSCNTDNAKPPTSNTRPLPSNSGTFRLQKQLSPHPERWLTLYDERGSGRVTLTEGTMLTDDFAFDDRRGWKSASIDRVEQVPFPNGAAAYLVSIETEGSASRHAVLLVTFADGALDIELCLPEARDKVELLDKPFRVRVHSEKGDVDYGLTNPNAVKLKRLT